MARALFGDPGRVEFKTLTSAQRLSAAAEGTVDMVADSVTITCERKEQVAFSADYYHDGQRLLVVRGSGLRTLADLAGHRVCSAKKTTSIATLEAARPAVVPVGVDHWTDCLVLLQLGEVEAVSTTEHVLQGLQAQDPSTEITGPAFTFEPHGITMAKQNTDLVRFTNAVLDRMRQDGTWKRLYTRWMGRFGPAPEPPAPRYRG
jgi:polar amino acid transport system substrate-binding protein